MHLLLDIAGVLFLLLAGIWLLTWILPVRLWIEAISAGVRVGIGDVIGMRLRRVDPASVVRPLIAATHAGLDVSAAELQSHALAGGDTRRVMLALIRADREGLDMPFEAAARFDLAGRDPLEEVEKERTRRRGAV
jgi:uncharacterized protein YqfA (UPF0365 family)